MPTRALAVPALALTVLLTATACGTAAPTSSPSGQATAAADVAATSSAATLPVTAAAVSSKNVIAIAPGAGAPAKAHPSDVQLTSYDKHTGRAVLAAGNGSAGRAGITGIHAGQLIASAPTKAAPRGALVSVTAVKPAANGTAVVSTRPATVAQLLGPTVAKGKAAIDAHSVQVQPLLKGLKVSFAPTPGGAAGSASAQLVLSADATVPLLSQTSAQGSAQSTAELSGSLELDPSVDFSYQGVTLGSGPAQAHLGFDLGAHASWRLSATVGSAITPIRLPIAQLSANPVLMVGALPVVINLSLTCYLTVNADGTVTVDAEQHFDGDWGVHADYTKQQGWTSGGNPATTTLSPVRADFSGNGSVRTGLAVESEIGLYDAVGVEATVEPYLRAAVNGNATIDSTGKAPTASGQNALYGGVDVTGALLAHLSILGTPVFQASLPLPGFHHEWPVPLPGSATATPAPSASASASATASATPAG